MLAIALTLAVLTGCSGSSTSGSVTLDGAPVTGGAINFIPQGGAPGSRPTGGEILGGKYSLEGAKSPHPGKYRVEIFWKKKTGKQIPVIGDAGHSTDETAEVIPPTYNTQTTLEADVKSGGNTFNYDLKSR